MIAPRIAPTRKARRVRAWPLSKWKKPDERVESRATAETGDIGIIWTEDGGPRCVRLGKLIRTRFRGPFPMNVFAVEGEVKDE